MPTAATYIPIQGNFDAASFVLESGDNSTVDRDASANAQGVPRAGKMQWTFELHIPDPTVGDDDTYTLFVRCPFEFTAADLVNAENPLRPRVWIPQSSTDVITQLPLIIADDFDAATQLLEIDIRVTAPAASNIVLLVYIDFQHSLPA